MLQPRVFIEVAGKYCVTTRNGKAIYIGKNVTQATNMAIEAIIKGGYIKKK